ncbi:hypothetical protein NQT74_11410 [Alteromonas stellipolaris]|uniref:hypothetical protein n=1 Tax=Alteromonas stellipolaris TaxID=233316 RepID=UPI0021187F8A|nr:hypothetical protein [Alteromonas stellipolaris]MCQ8849191.1 hypothetical protein [Alteromonas stellipolaris]
MRTLNAEEINAVSGGGIDNWLTFAEVLYGTLSMSHRGYSNYVGSGRSIEHTTVW